MKQHRPRLGTFLKEKRTAAGLTQAELGEKLGYTSQFIANWERDASSPPANRLNEIIRILNIDEVDLLEILTEDSVGYWKSVLHASVEKQKAALGKKKA